MEQSNRNNNPLGVGFKTGTTIVRVLCLLLAVSVLSSCSAQKEERDWNDMYEVRSYQVETITNEIVTTVFISTNVETNRVRVLAQPVTDFGGYDFEYIEAPATTSPEFRCLDGSCGIKE